LKERLQRLRGSVKKMRRHKPGLSKKQLKGKLLLQGGGKRRQWLSELSLRKGLMLLGYVYRSFVHLRQPLSNSCSIITF
jgi:hypothetical protein